MFLAANIKTPPIQRKAEAGKNGMRLADHRSGRVAQLKVISNAAQSQPAVGKTGSASSVHVVQRAKKNQAVATTGGAVALGLAGAYIGSALLPGLGTVGGAVLGGLAGLVTGGVGGYLLSKPTIYRNLQNDQYEDELETLRQFQEENRDADNDYDRGTIVTYSNAKRNQRRFIGLLQHGGVLYTYSESNKLSIGSPANGAMKHAIVAGNANVKAAGWANPTFTPAQENEQRFQATLLAIQELKKEKRKNKVRAGQIIAKYQLNDLTEIDKVTNKKDWALINDFKQTSAQLEYQIGEADRLRDEQREDAVITKNSQIRLNNSSGHYHPAANTKAEAFEGWKNAGFKNLTWKAWGTR